MENNQLMIRIGLIIFLHQSKNLLFDSHFYRLLQMFRNITVILKKTSIPL